MSELSNCPECGAVPISAVYEDEQGKFCCPDEDCVFSRIALHGDGWDLFAANYVKPGSKRWALIQISEGLVAVSPGGLRYAIISGSLRSRGVTAACWQAAHISGMPDAMGWTIDQPEPETIPANLDEVFEALEDSPKRLAWYGGALVGAHEVCIGTIGLRWVRGVRVGDLVEVGRDDITGGWTVERKGGA